MMRVPFARLAPGEDAARIDEAIRRVVKSGRYVLGPEVEAFEHEFAAASGLPHGVGVGTGTDAIALALRALGIGRGDEVVTTALSAAYTGLAIAMAGAQPVFADIDPRRLTLAPAAVEAALTGRTRAIVPVHLYGQAAEMPALRRIARAHGLAIVEDCCQAHLATCAGEPVGSFGDAAAFSFYPTKNLGALGDGGLVLTRDAALAARVRRLRNGGQTDRYLHVEAGVNSRLDELQAAVLRARLPMLQTWTARRRSLAARYRRALQTEELAAAGLAVPQEIDGGHVYHLFVVQAEERYWLARRLAAEGVETLVHYPVPMPLQAAFGSQPSGGWPLSEDACARLLSLPLYPAMDDSQVDAVCESIRIGAGCRR